MISLVSEEFVKETSGKFLKELITRDTGTIRGFRTRMVPGSVWACRGCCQDNRFKRYCKDCIGGLK